MAAVLFRLRTEARARWRAWAGLALLVGVFGGAVIAVAAGARRTDTAYPRFVRATKAFDIEVFNVPGASLGNVDFDAVQRLPQVVDAGRTVGFATAQPDLQLDAVLSAYGTRFNRFHLLSGRLPASDAVDEVVVGFTLARSRHLHVGSTLTVGMLPRPPAGATEAPGADTRAPGADTGAGAQVPPPVDVALRVVGVEAAAGEFPPSVGTGTKPAWASAAFARTYLDTMLSQQQLALRLRRGAADLPAVSDALQQLGGGKPVATAEQVQQMVLVRHSLHLQAVALSILAALAALTVALVTGQLLGRQTALESSDHPVLGALGMSSSQLWTLGAVRAVLVGAEAAVVAGAVAVALSPLFPIGLARMAEPTPGLSLDAPALLAGAVAVGMVVALLGALPVWRWSSRGGAPTSLEASLARRPSAVAAFLARNGAPTPATAGVRMALEPGRGRTAVPVRTTIVGALVAVTALTASITFQASLSHLLSSPELYGATFDGAVNRTGGDDITVGPALPVLLADPATSAVAVGYTGIPVQLGKVSADAVALEARKGSLPLQVIQGRAPEAADEVAVGTRTLRDLRARVGQTVPARLATTGAPPVPVHIVGRAVLPQESDSSGLGQGTLITPDGLRRLGGGDELPDPTNAVVRFRRGIDPAKGRTELQARLTASLGSGWTILAPDKPTDVVNFGHVQNLPLVLAALLGALAAASIGHLLVSSVRRRRHDLAVLKSLGFVRRQVVAAVCWQATTLMVIALGIGVPLGVAAGRWAWGLLADQLGILPRPTTPLLALLALVPAALLLANAIAAVPAWSAGRTSPALVLRSE